MACKTGEESDCQIFSFRRGAHNIYRRFTILMSRFAIPIFAHLKTRVFA